MCTLQLLGENGENLFGQLGEPGIYLTQTHIRLNNPHRIIHQEGHPSWVESTALLVAPAEMHAQEQLKLQLWDSGTYIFFLYLKR